MDEPVLDNGLPVDDAPEEAPEAPAPEAPAWGGPSQDEWAALQGSVQQLAGMFQPVPEEPVVPSYEDYFPADPVTGESQLTYEGLEKFVQDRINQGVQAQLGQYEPILNQTVAERGEAMIQTAFDKLEAPADQGGAGLGSFDREYARELAEGYVGRGFAPDEAIRRGAERARDFAEAQRAAGVEQYKTTLQNIGNAPRDSGVTGAGLDSSDERLPVGHADRYKQIADNWAARQRAS